MCVCDLMKVHFRIIDQVEFVNPLVTDPLYTVCMTKKLFKKEKRSSKKFPMRVAPMSR